MTHHAKLRTAYSLRRHFPSTALTDLLKIRYPIIQAPMSPITPPSLVAATSNAGGLGSLAAARMSPTQLTAEIAAIRKLTNQPFAVNLFVPKDGGSYDNEHVQHVRAILATRVLPNLRQQAVDSEELPPPPPPAWSTEQFDQSVLRFERQVEALLSSNTPPLVFSFTFGIPSTAILQQCRQRGVLTLGTATTPAEATALLETRLVDGIVVQGAEAGGHRGSFLTSDTDTVQRSTIGLFALLPLIRLLPQPQPAVPVPLISAGGVMHGSQLAAALLLGADGVQCGTRFLTATEATLTPPAHRTTLLEASQQFSTVGSYRDTVLTRTFSGRPARGFYNDMVSAFTEHSSPPVTPLPWEVQSSQVQPYVRAAMAAGDVAWMQMWAGQLYPLCDEKMVNEIVQEMIDEAKAVLE